MPQHHQHQRPSISPEFAARLLEICRRAVRTCSGRGYGRDEFSLEEFQLELQDDLGCDQLPDLVACRLHLESLNTVTHLGADVYQIRRTFLDCSGEGRDAAGHR